MPDEMTFTLADLSDDTRNPVVIASVMQTQAIERLIAAVDRLTAAVAANG